MMAAADMTGAQLADLLRAEAYRRGVRVNDFMRPLTSLPASWLTQLSRAGRPKISTIERIEALLAGAPVPPPSPNNFGARPITKRVTAGDVGGRMSRIDVPAAAIPKIQRSPEPCFFCATRGGLACQHRPDEGAAL